MASGSLPGDSRSYYPLCACHDRRHSDRDQRWRALSERGSRIAIPVATAGGILCAHVRARLCGQTHTASASVRGCVRSDVIWIGDADRFEETLLATQLIPPIKLATAVPCPSFHSRRRTAVRLVVELRVEHGFGTPPNSSWVLRMPLSITYTSTPAPCQCSGRCSWLQVRCVACDQWQIGHRLCGDHGLGQATASLARRLNPRVVAERLRLGGGHGTENPSKPSS